MYYRIYRLKIKKSSMIIPSISHSSGYTVYGNPTDATSARSPPVVFFFPQALWSPWCSCGQCGCLPT